MPSKKISVIVYSAISNLLFIALIAFIVVAVVGRNNGLALPMWVVIVSIVLGCLVTVNWIGWLSRYGK